MAPSEQQFETDIEQSLLSSGYLVRKHSDYNRALCLDPEPLLDFILATQAQEWKRLKQHHGSETRERFLTRVSREVERRGVIDVLRNKIKDSGCTFELYYPKPSSTLNPDRQRVYLANQFSVIRQLHFSDSTEQSLDLTIFLNGLPIFTAELKTPLTGQNIDNAIRQYKTDRDPREPLLRYKRCIAHFAVDPDAVAFATELKGQSTRFFPFNKGYRGGAGNPPMLSGYSSAYLWEEIWQKDSVLDLIRHFVHPVREEDQDGKTSEYLIFPRYHQLDSVRRLIGEALRQGPGPNYLIQHSAGSGKTFTISWLAHQLSTLHDQEDNRIFDSIIVVSDRRVIDRQLQHAMRQFEQTLGVVENIDTTSRKLKDALEGGKTIVVTTLQKFPVIVNQITELPGQRFAVIIDEAHSSQSGETARHMKQTLMVKDLDEAELEDQTDSDDTIEDEIINTIRSRGNLPNVSTFAFTATPKAKTLELFGTRDEDGSYQAFSLYSMRQAIEEGFILDVLQNYTTFRSYWELLQTVQTDEKFPKRKAAALLRSYVELHDNAINTKVEIMLEHFMEQVRHRIKGRAKAMIVTRSRLHAVRFRLAVDRYLEKEGHPFKALVAFTGTVTDEYGSYTEANMNGIPETQTVETFKQDDYRIMIVASKFQTGFDQPLLHTMYVDKKLGGVQAVQTLSRLNRTYPGKSDTMVLDFTNGVDEIEHAFQPYYQRTILRSGTDPNKLYDLETDLQGFDLYTEEDVNRFATAFFQGDSQATLHAVLRPVVERYEELDEDDQEEFRGKLNDYVRLYGFISQLITFEDRDLETLYQFARYLFRLLPIRPDELPIEVLQDVDMESYRIGQTNSGNIGLTRGISEVPPAYNDGTGRKQDDEMEALSEIIKQLNERFRFSGEHTERMVRDLRESILTDNSIEGMMRVNSPADARLEFDVVVDERMQERVDTQFEFYKEYTDNQDFRAFVIDWLFDQYRSSAAAS